MFNIGPGELMVVLVIALMVLGPRRLPEAGRSLGSGLREFRGALRERDRDDGEPSRPGRPAPPVFDEAELAEP